MPLFLTHDKGDVVGARPNGAVPESGARRSKNRLLSAGIEFPQRPVSNRALPRLAAQSADYRYTVQIELIDTGGTARLGWTMAYGVAEFAFLPCWYVAVEVGTAAMSASKEWGVIVCYIFWCDVRSAIDMVPCQP